METVKCRNGRIIADNTLRLYEVLKVSGLIGMEELSHRLGWTPKKTIGILIVASSIYPICETDDEKRNKKYGVIEYDPITGRERIKEAV